MARPTKKATKSKGKGPRSTAARDGVPDIYKEMLQDAVSSPPPSSNLERPLKRRRVGDRSGPQSDSERFTNRSNRGLTSGHTTDGTLSEDQQVVPQRQTAYSDLDDSEESEVNWEEVILEDDFQAEDMSANKQNLDLVLGDSAVVKQNSRQASRRKPATSAERKLKLDIHKMHVLCLLSHVYLRNHWCNDDKAHQSLRGILSSKTVSYLNPDEKLSQFQRSRSFNDGLSQAVDAFKSVFTVTARGICKPYWAQDSDHIADIELPQDIDLPMQKSDFQGAAVQRVGSRDVGAQLFCALLRSVGVDARLTCSLQPLPFHTAPSTKSMQSKESIALDKFYTERPAVAENKQEVDSEILLQGAESTSQAIGSIGGRSRFAPQSTSDMMRSSDSHPRENTSASSSGHRRRIVESQHPIYWIEAFEEANQKWVPVDPLVTKTVGKSRKFEPPISDRENNMSYVIAFEDEGSARDVTKRYVKAYNAKTRKTRVDVAHDGEGWLRGALKMYKQPHRLVRDQIEDTELARKEAQEGLPQNVQDFKDHPYYALERHIRKNEIIHPKREVGKVNAGRTGSAKGLEPIYRRRDVHMVKSADRWYRLGREVKTGEQPLKHATPRRSHGFDRGDAHGFQSDGNEDEDNIGTSLYAFHQTIEYSPPPVLSGKIPKNMYGNLDLYVPSMIPKGAVHSKHPETQRAARLLGIDYADAVTGFSFKGRHGTAIITGAVVDSDCADAVQAVLNTFEDDRVQAEEARRSFEALRMWKKLLVGLRIRERIEGYEFEGERDAVLHDEAVTEVDPQSQDAGGGFLPGSTDEPIAEPTARSQFQHDQSDREGIPINSLIDSDRDSDTARNQIYPREVFDNSADNCEGGGFLPQEDDEDAEDALKAVSYNAVRGHASDEDGACEGGGFVIGDIAMSSGPTMANEHHSTEGNELQASLTKPADDSRVAEDEKSDLESPKHQHKETILGVQSNSSSGRFRAGSHSPHLGLAEDDLAEALTLQQSYETSQPSTQLIPEAHEPQRFDSGLSPGPMEDNYHDEEKLIPTTPKVIVADEPSSTQSTPSVASNPDALPDDGDALLAEDPSDEDADPEWLA